MSDIRAGDLFRSTGVQMFITYDLDDRRDPTIERWVFAQTEDDPDHGFGWLEIRVREIVDTQNSGTLVVHHRQWFTGYGEPFNRGRRYVTTLSSLRSLIKRRNMSLVEKTVDQKSDS